MIQSLSLENFRSYEKKTFEFSNGVTIVEGNNGIGKTNIIEAIYALATGKPFRSSKREVFLYHNAEHGRISGHIHNNNNEDISIFWQRFPTRKTGYFWNNITLSAAEYLQRKLFFAVLFSPEEMNLPFFAPKYRRAFLDRLLSPLFPEYFEAISKYNITLKNRNQLLHAAQEKPISPQQFIFWDTELCKWETIVRQYRQDFFIFANQKISEEYKKISGSTEPVQLLFYPSAPADISFAETLKNNFDADKARGSTNKGPHRDDFEILLRELPVEQDASRGETRSTLLALKSIEREYIQQHSKSCPIILLDDVFSELDENHRTHLLQSLTDTQTIITTTDCTFSDQVGKKYNRIFLP